MAVYWLLKNSSFLSLVTLKALVESDMIKKLKFCFQDGKTLTFLLNFLHRELPNFNISGW